MDAVDRRLNSDGFHQSPHLLAVVALDGTLKVVNQSWKRLLGYEFSELVGRPLFRLVDDDDRSRAMRLLNPRLVDTEPAPIDLPLRCKDRSYRTFSWQRRKVAAEETMFLTGTDITEKKMMETTSNLRLHELQAQWARIQREQQPADKPDSAAPTAPEWTKK